MWTAKLVTFKEEERATVEYIDLYTFLRNDLYT